MLNSTNLETEVRALPAPRMARLAVIIFFFVNGAVFANWVSRIPDVKAKLGMSEGTLGLVLLGAAIGALISQPVTGWLIGRYGSRRFTLALGIIYSLSIILPSLMPSPLFLTAALFFVGMFNGGLDVSMNSQAAMVEEQYRKPIMSSFHAMWSVGGLVGASVGGLAAVQQVDLFWHFVTVALFAIVLLVIGSRWLIADDPHPDDETPHFALPPRSLIALGIIAFCALLSEGAIADWSGVYLRDGLGSDPSLAALGYAIFAAFMAGGRFVGDWLTSRFGARSLVGGSGALVAAGILMVLVSPSAIPAIVGFGLVGAGVSCIFPVILSAASRTPGVLPSTGIAAMATMGYTGFLIGPPIIGYLAEAITLRGALGVLGLLGITIVALSVTSWRAPQPAGS